MLTANLESAGVSTSTATITGAGQTSTKTVTFVSKTTTFTLIPPTCKGTHCSVRGRSLPHGPASHLSPTLVTLSKIFAEPSVLGTAGIDSEGDSKQLDRWKGLREASGRHVYLR